MHNQSSEPESMGLLSGGSGANEAEATGNQGPTSHQPSSSEDMRIESLAKEALAETIREGGAFASENSDQLKS